MGQNQGAVKSLDWESSRRELMLFRVHQIRDRGMSFARRGT